MTDAAAAIHIPPEDSVLWKSRVVAPTCAILQDVQMATAEVFNYTKLSRSRA